MTFENAKHFVTLYPGIPYRVTWTFRLPPVDMPSNDPSQGNMFFTEIGKMYTLILRDGFSLGSYVGTKEELATLTKQSPPGQAWNVLWRRRLGKDLWLVGENEVEFEAIP